MPVAIIQPFIPDYRADFFKGINENIQLDIYAFNQGKGKKSNFSISDVKVKPLSNFSVSRFMFYNIFQLLQPKYNKLILILDFTHISTWILLFTKFAHRKEIIIWGQGISVKRYLKEETSPNFLIKLMIKISDALWVYTDKEKAIFQKIFPNKKIIALHNTISNLKTILASNNDDVKPELKQKYGITQPTCLIFCARFDSPYRRVDLLEKTIQSLDINKYGFIIIGDGKNKPDFTKYSNVYDFGAVYDHSKKSELFAIADLYFQPGWVGLSIVEAMAYGKPILTFKRTTETLQCVEYSYITEHYNGLIFDNIEDCINTIKNTTEIQIRQMGTNAKQFVKSNLSMSNMVRNAMQTL